MPDGRERLFIGPALFVEDHWCNFPDAVCGDRAAPDRVQMRIRPARRTQRSRRFLAAGLARLQTAGAIYLADGTVTAACSLSGAPIRHRLRIGESTLYANGGLDALAVPFLVAGDREHRVKLRPSVARPS